MKEVIRGCMMSKTTIYLLILTITLLLNSCSYIYNLNTQKKYKYVYQKEIEFVKILINEPLKMDSIIINSKYYNKEIYNLLEHQIKSEGNLIEYYSQNYCKPNYRDVNFCDTCFSRNNMNLRDCVYIFFSYPCRKEEPYGFVFVFGKINEEIKLIDVYGIHY